MAALTGYYIEILVRYTCNFNNALQLLQIQLSEIDVSFCIKEDIIASLQMQDYFPHLCF